jgi:hypothetical protein
LAWLKDLNRLTIGRPTIEAHIYASFTLIQGRQGLLSRPTLGVSPKKKDITNNKHQLLIRLQEL